MRLMALLILLSGCTWLDPTTVACQTDADCVDDFVCVGAEPDDPGLCAATGADDDDAVADDDDATSNDDDATSDDDDSAPDDDDATSDDDDAVNLPPEAPTVHVEPRNPFPGEEIDCIVDALGADPESDQVSLTMTWTADGTPVTTGLLDRLHTGDRVGPGVAEAGQIWACTATPNDGTQDGPSSTARSNSVKDEGLFTSLRAGPSSMLCGVTADGWGGCWGWAHVGWLGGPWEIVDEEWTDFVGGSRYLCGQRPDDTLQCWGAASSSWGETPTIPLSTYDIGTEFVAALSAIDSTVTVWGSDYPNTTTDAPLGAFTDLVTDHRQAACVTDSDGAITCWGDDSAGLVSNSPSGDGWSGVKCSPSRCCALSDAGEATCWGWTSDAPADSGWSSIHPSDGGVFVLDADGAISGSGFGDYVEGAPTSTGWQTLEHTWDGVCALHDSANVRCWEDSGVEGSAIHMTDTYTALDVAMVPDLSDLYACAVTVAGEIECFGVAPDEQAWNLGGHRPPTGTGWAEVAVGQGWGCALDALGEATCWGPTTFTDPPSGPPTGPGFTDLEGEGGTACVLDDLGALHCWGTALAGTPTGIGYQRLELQPAYGCAIDAAGGIECWGDGVFGVTPDSGPYSDLALTTDYACAIRAVGGELDCWGVDDPCSDWDDFLPAPTDGGWERVVPWQASGGNSFEYPRACAQKADGTTECWGCDAGKPVPTFPTALLDASSSHRSALALDGFGRLGGWGSAWIDVHWERP
jgi:hypothetical protein